MSRLPGLLTIGALLLPIHFATAQEPMTLDTPEKRFSYAIGQNVGSGIKKDLGASGFDVDAFVAAMQDVFKGDGGRMSEEEMGAAFEELQAVQRVAQAAAAKEFTAAGDAFLAEQAAKDGVQATESGLLYQIVTEGTGAKPSATDTVTVHYTGRLLDGKVFDSSVERGQPAEFPVNRVIPGWTEALQLMPVGSTWEVWIPQHLAYGENGAGADIPPYAVLNFTIELISIAGG